LAGKHRKEKVERAPTKHQISKFKKQERLSRLIMIATIAVVIVIAGIIAYGIYNEQVMPYEKTVIKVNDASFSMDYYIKTMAFMSSSVTTDMIKYYTDVTATAIEQAELIKEKAPALGITANDDEISKEIDLMKTTPNQVSKDVATARIMAKKYMDQQCYPNVPKTAEQVEVEAMALEAKNLALDRQQKLNSGIGDNFTQSATMLSLDSVTQGKGGYLGWIAKGYESFGLGDLQNTVLKDVIFTLDPKKVSDPIYDPNLKKSFGYWVVEVLEKDDTKGIHARAILFSLKEDADAVRTRLLNGESWDTLAKQYSQDDTSKDNGGDLGWIQPGVATNKGSIERIVTTLEPNKISDVLRDPTIATTGGYWLVEILNKQSDRPLDESLRESIASDCLGTWVQGLMKEAKIQNLLDQTQKDFAVAKVTKDRGK
jgi:parvulin-like peptidyl-prolyl isomerase